MVSRYDKCHIMLQFFAVSNNGTMEGCIVDGAVYKLLVYVIWFFPVLRINSC